MKHIPHKCQALSGDAKLCGRVAKHAESYHGDNELYGYANDRPYWVMVWFCEEHKGPGLRSFKPQSKRAAQAEPKGERDGRVHSQ